MFFIVKLFEVADELAMAATVTEELRGKLKQMLKNQQRTNLIMANMMSFIQSRFPGEDVYPIIQAARQVYYIFLFCYPVYPFCSYNVVLCFG